MPYCPRCGVELDASVRACPLCRTEIPRFADQEPGEPAWPSQANRTGPDPSKVHITPGQARSRALWGIASVFATAGASVVAADWFTAGSVGWAWYPVVSLAATLVFTASMLVWHRRPAVWGPVWLLTTAGLLTGLDALGDGRLDWSLPLGVPLATVTFALVTTGVWLLRRLRRHGFNVFALVLALVCAELAAIDGLTTGWLTGRLGWGWSVIAALVILPLASLFLVLHLAIPRTPDLRRTFHF